LLYINNGDIMDYIDYYKLKNNKSIIERIRVGIYNKKYIKNMLLETKELLDNINGYPLDKSQRIAVLTDEISNLVVAGAGSGKT